MSRLASPTSSFFINEVIKGGWGGEGEEEGGKGVSPREEERERLPAVLSEEEETRL